MGRIQIQSLDDSRLDVFRDMRKTNQTRHAGLFIAEGTTLVERLFHSDYEIHSVLASDQKLRNFESRIPRDVTVYHLERELAAELVGYSFHTGVMAAAHMKRTPDLASVIPPSGGSLVLFGDQIIDQQNVGLMIRIGAAFGASAIVLGPGSADPFSRRVLRVSMGNGLFLPIVESNDSSDTLQALLSLGHRCCATVLDADATELSDFSFPERSVIVFGNETHGIKDTVLAHCETKLTVSMLNGTDSLNVAIAAGIFSHSYRTQHSLVSKTGFGQ